MHKGQCVLAYGKAAVAGCCLRTGAALSRRLELIRLQMQPSKDAAFELGHSESVSEQEYVVWKHMDIGVMLLGRCESVKAGMQPDSPDSADQTGYFTVKFHGLVNNKIQPDT